MSHVRSVDARRDVEAAIRRVLDAEQTARASLEAAQADAASLTEDARSAVRALEARTERRLGKIRAAFAMRADDAVAALDAEAREPAAPPHLTPEELSALERAVAAVAAMLTSRSS